VKPIFTPRRFGSAAIVSSVLALALNREVVDDGLVLVGDDGDLRRQREHDVEVRHICSGEHMCRYVLSPLMFWPAAGVPSPALARDWKTT